MSSEPSNDIVGEASDPKRSYPVKWYRSTFWNITILGLCNFAAPGIWNAMNSLGAGGAESPELVNAANALTFCLMVVSCYFSGVVVHYIGIKGALIFGTIGYAPFAAGLYTNNRFGTEWLVYLGATLCGISAGVFWMAETAIAIAYPEPWNRGKALGYWLSYRIAGQVLGGAINLGINADRNEAGSVSYAVYIVFIVLQCTGPFVALLLNRPKKVMRKDGKSVKLGITENPWRDIAKMTKLFFGKKFLLILLFIGQAVFSEAVFFTYLDVWFTVRARALGSFCMGLVAAITGNILGNFLDLTSISLKTRTRSAFWMVTITQGAWWIWLTINVTQFYHLDPAPVFDWVTPGFGRAFAIYVFLGMGFQLNYLFLYFVITQYSSDEGEIIRYAALLRGTESGWAAISYGLTSLPLWSKVGATYLNFALWAVAILPAWLAVRHFGTTKTVEESSSIDQRDGEVVETNEGEAKVVAK